MLSSKASYTESPRHDPVPTSSLPAAQTSATMSSQSLAKKRKHKNKKRKNRRQSFIATEEADSARENRRNERPSLLDTSNQVSSSRDNIYILGRGNMSSESLDSEALLDHRDSGPLQARRQSVHRNAWPNGSQSRLNTHRGSQPSVSRIHRAATVPNLEPDRSDDDANDSTPLLASSYFNRPIQGRGGYGYASTQQGHRFSERLASVWPPHSRDSSRSSRQRRSGEQARNSSRDLINDYDVNNPPSVPNSPKFGPSLSVHDAILSSEMPIGDTIIDIDSPGLQGTSSASPTGGVGPGLKKRMTMYADAAEEDVCFPQDILSEIAEEDEPRSRTEIDQGSTRPRRRRRKQWPDLAILEEWSIEEKEERALEGDVRTRKVHEPLYVEGRLRPRKFYWHREAEDAPYRFTYFNEEFESTVHSQTISELVQPGQTFQSLFIPEPPLLDESESELDEEDLSKTLQGYDLDKKTTAVMDSRVSSVSRGEPQRPELIPKQTSATSSSDSPGRGTPIGASPTILKEPRKVYGPRPVFWLDVLCPTDAEMKVLSKTFGIHPLTAEDIMMQEAREKVELFKNYYFVTYRSFEQDINSEDYMEPVNLYIIVFREGILSFHFSQTPHPANVRRRIRQLSDYLFLSTDWISYALIDDVTDAYAPLIQRIEEEVDSIDQRILDMHMNHDDENSAVKTIRKLGHMITDREEWTEKGELESGMSQTDMLRHVGHWRKKVMSMYRLLGTKADVIKGFAKRCNEQWEVAPRSEIGLYLGDIQDHIVTMTGNLSHYENILSRAHSNYLAQINIRMNERAENTNDVLGKLTVLGTIVLPMNVVTGLWGMNTRVPGEDGEMGDLTWFYSITGALLLSGFICFLVARRTFGVV